MANEIFNMNALWSVKSEDKNHTLQLGSYGGRMSFSMFTGVGQGRPDSFPISMEGWIYINDIIRKLLKESSGAAFPVRYRTYDMNNRKYNVAKQLMFGIDENGIYYIEYKNVESGATVRFPIRGTNTYEVGVEADSKVTRSKIGFTAFVNIFNKLIEASFFTRNNIQTGGGTRTTSNNSSTYQSSSQAAPSESNYDSDEIY